MIRRFLNLELPSAAARFGTAGVIVIALLATPRPARAADPAAAFLVHMFSDICVANLGHPDAVRTWAEQHSLVPIQNTQALGLFVGPGNNGGAWRVADGPGHFVLSIRGLTRSCAVWAQAADPAEVETNFKAIVENVRRPGIEVTVDKDTVAPSPSGAARALVYNVTAPHAPTSFEFTLLTAQRTGGAFQASMQAALAGPHPN